MTPPPPTPTLAIFVGSTMGDTMDAAERIAARLEARLGRDVPLFDIGRVDARRLEEFDVLLIGCSTWNIGELQAFWDRKLPELGGLELQGKRVALFGSGDQLTYGDTFQDALGILGEAFEERGAVLRGAWPVEGYEHLASLGQRGDRFVGLALDYDNQDERTEERIERWTDQVIDECGLAAPPAPTVPLEPPEGRSGTEPAVPPAPRGPDRPLAAWRMDELLAVCPEAADVLARHGVDPRTRCHAAARGSLPLKKVLGRVCPVDDAGATLAELEALLAARRGPRGPVAPGPRP